jgi:LPXTG-motif cell wall-anchored protein
MNKTAINILAFIITTLFVVINAGKVSAAPKLTLTPATKSVANGETFTVVIGVNSDPSKSNAVDVWGTYDKDKLELVSIVKSTSPVYSFDFSSAPAIDATAGTFRFSCPSNNLNSFDTTVISGELAVATFRAKASGTANVRFDCTAGSTTDSNIFSDIDDVISCSDNSSGVYTITGVSSVVITPTTATIQNQLPQTGGVATTIGLVVFGAISLISALFLKFL